MKKARLKFTLIFMTLAAVLFGCSFTFDKDSSLKSLTHPYINTYECSYAHFGRENLLDKYEYFTVTLLDSKNLEVAYKAINGKRHIFGGEYELNDDTGEFNAYVGVFGVKFRQQTAIVNGKFCVNLSILGIPLIMRFEVK